MAIKFSNEKPPIYDKCVEQFGVDWEDGIIFTYGDTIHSKYDVTPQKKAHERTHVRQQINYGAEAWWDKYFEDAEFRLSQELEAYRNEVRWLKENIKDRNQKFKDIQQVAKDLSSSIYGDIINYSEALCQVQNQKNKD